jgi:hypothetical protein
MPEEFNLDPFLETAQAVKRCSWPECEAACCIYGAWVDQTLVEEINRHSLLISPHMSPDLRPVELWFDGRIEPDKHALSGKVAHTTILPNSEHYGGTSCIFLRADYQCALQTAALENDLHPWRFKPFYCILHPLEIDKLGRITLDDTDLLVAETASCVRKSSRKIALIETFRQEIDYLSGGAARRRLKNNPHLSFFPYKL